MPKLFKYLLLAVLILLFRYLFSYLVLSVYKVSPQENISLMTVPNYWLQEEAGASYSLAQYGYSYIFDEFSGETNVVRSDWYIFPLYLLVLKGALQMVTSIAPGTYMYHVGPFLSTLFLGLSLYFLDKLLEKVWLYDDKKYFVILLMLLFPAAFMLTMSGPLSLFILLSILFFYFLFQRKYALSAFFLSMAMFTELISVIYIIPFFYFVNMAEKYNPKFPKTAKMTGYAALLTSPVLLTCYSAFEQTGDFFLFFRPSYWFEGFNFVPFAPLVKFIGSRSYLYDVSGSINALAILILSAVIMYVFIRMYFIFENRSVEQNMLFMAGFLSLLVVSVLPLSLNILGAILSFVPFFMLFAMVATFPVRSPVFLSMLFVLLNIQTLLFVNFMV